MSLTTARLTIPKGKHFEGIINKGSRSLNVRYSYIDGALQVDIITEEGIAAIRSTFSSVEENIELRRIGLIGHIVEIKDDKIIVEFVNTVIISNSRESKTVITTISE